MNFKFFFRSNKKLRYVTLRKVIVWTKECVKKVRQKERWSTRILSFWKKCYKCAIFSLITVSYFMSAPSADNARSVCEHLQIHNELNVHFTHRFFNHHQLGGTKTPRWNIFNKRIIEEINLTRHLKQFPNRIFKTKRVIASVKESSEKITQGQMKKSFNNLEKQGNNWSRGDRISIISCQSQRTDEVNFQSQVRFPKLFDIGNQAVAINIKLFFKI